MQGGIDDPWTVKSVAPLATTRPANDNHLPPSPIQLGPGGCSDRFMQVYRIYCPANTHTPLLVS